MLSYKSEMEFEARKDFNVDKVKFYECVKKKRTNVYSHELSYFYIHLQLEIILDKYAMKLIFCFAWCFLLTRMTPHNCKLKHSNIANCKSSCWTHYLLFTHWWCNLIYNANLDFLKNLAVFSTNWLCWKYVLNFQPKLNFSNNEQKFQPGTPG